MDKEEDKAKVDKEEDKAKVDKEEGKYPAKVTKEKEMVAKAGKVAVIIVMVGLHKGRYLKANDKNLPTLPMFSKVINRVKRGLNWGSRNLQMLVQCQEPLSQEYKVLGGIHFQASHLTKLTFLRILAEFFTFRILTGAKTL